MRRFLVLLDNYLLSLVSAFLLVFIPLYPKLPLFDLIRGYIVRVRLEDILILFAIAFYSIQVVRRKAQFSQTPLTKPILIYIGIGFLSVLSALFVTKTVPLHQVHVMKLLFHYFRRIEYFSLFFIFFASIRSVKQVKFYFLLFILTVAGVTIYGYGQKYLYWCAFSTMNREFSKGWCLYLSEHARVISTFGGHYDLAAFVMLALSLLWSLLFGLRNRWHKLITALLLAGSFWLIILTASRVSFLAYLMAVTIVVFLWMFKRGVIWGISRWVTAISLSLLVMLSFGDLSERFQRIFRLNERFGGIRSLLLKSAVLPPIERDALIVDDQLAAVTSKSDQPPSLIRPGTGYSGSTARPADVAEEVPEWVSTERLVDGTMREIPKKRVYSQAALRFDLSTSIRLDALWPRAWAGFLRNPLLGSGYSTLNKEKVTDFTEAESTDNGYLRALGETGILGSISFYAIIFTVLLIFFNALGGVSDPVFYSLIVGGIAGIVGLLINNSYIDIFEASKIALPFWSLSGTLVAGIVIEKDKIKENHRPLRIPMSLNQAARSLFGLIKSDYTLLVLIIILAFFLRAKKITTPLADWHSWRQADTSAVTRNFDRFGINVFYPTFDDLSSVASGMPNPRGLRMVEFPIYNVAAVWVKKIITEFTIEVAGRFTSILASLGSLVFLFLLTRRYLDKRIAILTAITFALLPYNIFYSRVILPEPSLVFSSLAMLFFASRYFDPDPNHDDSANGGSVFKDYVLATVFSAVSLLIKPYSAFLYLPLLYLIGQKKGWSGFLKPKTIVFFVLSAIPLAAWRLWISQFPEGIPAYTWLLNGDGIRFKGAFFFWIFADRIGRLILGYWGLIPFGLGLLIIKPRKAKWFFHIWAIAILLYIITFATGNVRHDYYQILSIPIISVFVGLGLEILFFTPPHEFKPILSRVLGIVASTFMVMFGWYYIRDFYNINHQEIVEAGKTVRNLTHWKAKVIAPYDGDTAFLYQTERFGWPVMDGTINQMIQKGAQYYVSVRDDGLTKELLRFAQHPDADHPYKLIRQDPQFVIIQLVADEYLHKD